MTNIETTMTTTPEYKLIDVSLYGTGPYAKANTKAHSVEVWCCAEKCTLRDDYKCLCKWGGFSFGDAKCPFGKKKINTGYTQRAKKYYSFVRQYKEMPEYGAMGSPNRTFVAKADNMYLMSMEGTQATFEDDGTCQFSWLGNTFVPEEYWTLDFLSQFVKYVDHYRNHRKRHDTKDAPMFLQALRAFDEDTYLNLLLFYPEISEYVFDPIGKKAKLITFRDDVEITIRDQKWIKNGTKLTCENYQAKDFSRTFAMGSVELKIDPEYALEVKDEAWVDEYTIFVE